MGVAEGSFVRAEEVQRVVIVVDRVLINAAALYVKDLAPVANLFVEVPPLAVSSIEAYPTG